MNLNLSRFNYDPNNLTLVASDVVESVFSGNFANLTKGIVPILMLDTEATQLFLIECMMRGTNFNIRIIKPDEHVFEGLCYFLHANNEYPDYDDDGYVWIRRPL